ncbi:hypothetical protein [Clostridium hydrogeniformans]|uniref:hypothetical protein n=1 Tax=Clostridium hydrogeniformans TaxID=349933 RepID=UPI000481545A|nr:hypothetical protein [Clostridium hydrogeniformans]
MKKIVSFLLVSILTLGLSACNKTENVEKPENVVNEYFTALKNVDIEEANKLTEGEAEGEDEDLSEIEMELVNKVFNNISVEVIGDAKVDGKNATVKAKVTTPDMKKTVELVIADCTTKVTKAAFEGKELRDEEIDKLVGESFIKQFENKDLAKITSEVDLSLVRKDNSWVIKEDGALENAIRAGLPKEIRKFEDKVKK